MYRVAHLPKIAVSIAASASFIVSSASVSDMTARANTYTTGVERAESKAFLAAHASCADCGEAATVVDHNTRHTEGDATIFWDKSRRVARCKRDHDRKSATLDGRFGFGRRQETARPSTQDDASHADDTTPLRNSRVARFVQALLLDVLDVSGPPAL